MVLNEEIFYKRDGKVDEAQSQIKVANHFYRISSTEEKVHYFYINIYVYQHCLNHSEIACDGFG
jgi:hypothetical protein